MLYECKQFGAVVPGDLPPPLAAEYGDQFQAAAPMALEHPIPEAPVIVPAGDGSGLGEGANRGAASEIDEGAEVGNALLKDGPRERAIPGEEEFAGEGPKAFAGVARVDKAQP